MTEPARPRLALLVDGENVTHQIAPALIRTASELGDPVVRRVYGRFATHAMSGWQACCGEHAMSPHAPSGGAAGKNAADIAMVIGAMDLLHRAGIAHFCLVSSDSDFSGLALHLREAGCTVHCVGRSTAAAALRSAYDRFITIESLVPAPPKTAVTSFKGSAKDVAPLIDAAFLAGSSGECRITMSALGVNLRRLQPGFEAKAYGYKNQISLVRELGTYEITTTNGTMWISPKARTQGTRH
jgi:hypothetical protein